MKFLQTFFSVFLILFVISSAHAAVNLKEFGGFADQFSHRFYTDTLPQIEAHYGDQVNLVFYHYPLSFQTFSQETAEASECAEDQGAFRAYHNALFEQFPVTTNEQLISIAQSLNLNMELFNECINTHATQQRVLDDFAMGTQNGVSGTPSFFIGDQFIIGAQPYNTFKQALDAALGIDDSNDHDPTAQDQQPEPVVGPQDAPVTIEAFIGFQDPYSGMFWRNTMPQILSAYPKEVRIVFTNFPFDFHENAKLAAIAGECAQARNQGAHNRFRLYADQLFAHQNALGQEQLVQYAAAAGLDSSEFSNCLSSRHFLPEVLDDVQQGTKRGITGTPMFFINGKQIIGAQSFDSFQSVIDGLLDDPKPPSDPNPKPPLFCGDKVCSEKENSVNCPVDCPQATPAACQEMDTVKFQCSNDTEVSWCTCLEGKWHCVEKPQEACPTNDPTPPVCNGCTLNDQCFSVSSRALASDNTPVYCELDKTIQNQKPDQSTCQNDFECISNSCNSGVCVNLQEQLNETKGILQQIVDWLSELFGFKPK